MLAPKNLKVGDTFDDDGVKRVVTEVIPFIGYKTEIITSSGVKKEEIAPTKKDVEIANLEDKGIKELQEMCKAKGLSIRGTKAEVIERLRSN